MGRVTDSERFVMVIKQIVGRRITYKELTGKTDPEGLAMQPS